MSSIASPAKLSLVFMVFMNTFTQNDMIFMSFFIPLSLPWLFVVLIILWDFDTILAMWDFGH